jgi:CENP-B N-terminal DNA-binding domain
LGYSQENILQEEPKVFNYFLDPLRGIFSKRNKRLIILKRKIEFIKSKYTFQMTTRTRKVPTIQQKLDIKRRLDDFESGTALAQEYYAGSSTISDMKKSRDTI